MSPCSVPFPPTQKLLAYVDTFLFKVVVADAVFTRIELFGPFSNSMCVGVSFVAGCATGDISLISGCTTSSLSV